LGALEEEEDFTLTARSIAWELIRFIAVWASEEC